MRHDPQVSRQRRPVTRHRDCATAAPPPLTCIPNLAPDPALAWIATLRHRARHREAVELLSMFYFGRRRPSVTARLVGLTPAALATFYRRISLPRHPDERNFGYGFDADLARRTLEVSGYTLATCRLAGTLFWVHSERSPQHRASDGMSAPPPG